MTLSDDLIRELQIIIKEDYGRAISFEEAKEIGEGINKYFDLLAKIYYRIGPEAKKKPPDR